MLEDISQTCLLVQLARVQLWTSTKRIGLLGAFFFLFYISVKKKTNKCSGAVVNRDNIQVSLTMLNDRLQTQMECGERTTDDGQLKRELA